MKVTAAAVALVAMVYESSSIAEYVGTYIGEIVADVVLGCISMFFVF